LATTSQFATNPNPISPPEQARQFLPLLAGARVTPWRCRCGCPSFNFFIPGHPLPSDGFAFLESDKGGADPLISHPNNLNRTFNVGFC
jgi:hypothetical protein